jgi:hypothetical protein
MAIELSPGLEKRLNKLSMKHPLLNRLLSLFFMPFVFKSGLRINFDPDNYYAILPKRRINQNWYGTMGGGAILGNTELAAGSYLFLMTRGEYRMVCKSLDYRFLLPSTEAVMYKATCNLEELDEKVRQGGKFNIDMDIKVYRTAEGNKPGKRIGGGLITFHVWPIGS